jgi:hypothetical protein
MSHSLTDSSSFDTVTVPDDGDGAVAASVNVGFQALANRDKYLRDSFPNGYMIGGQNAVVTSGLNSDWQAILALWLGGTLYTYPSLITMNAANIEGGGSFAAGWYYAYAYVSSGSLAFQLSTTAPDILWKDSTLKTHRYMGCIYAESSSIISKFHKVGQKYIFAIGRVALTDPSTPSTGGTYQSAAVPGAAIPPHVRMIGVKVKLTNTSASNHYYGRVRSPGSVGTTDAGSALQLFAEGDTPNRSTHGCCELALDASQQFEWTTENTAAQLSVLVHSFLE